MRKRIKEVISSNNVQIDKETYLIEKSNYHEIVSPKKQIILAESLRSESNHIKRWKKKDFGASKSWSTFTISRSGTIYQHYDPQYHSDFMGIEEIDKHSISIVLENMGALHYDYGKNKYYNWCMEECPENLIFDKEWKDYSHWEKHNIDQTKALVELCKQLCKDHKIEIDNIGFNFFAVETIDFYGIVCRSNYSLDYNDLNPSFDFKFFLKNMGIKF